MALRCRGAGAVHPITNNGNVPLAPGVLGGDNGAGFGWMKNLLFNEPTMAMRESVLQAAIAKVRADAGAV